MGDASSLPLGRREFLVGAAALGAGLTLVSPAAVRGADANSKINLGIIGCGGRGQWIGELFKEHGGYQVTALHDFFPDRVNAAGEKLGVPSAQRYTGLDGHKQLLAEAKVDAVAIISPPYFHPEQVVAALNAGKHVYLAKPIAVDVPGCMAIVEAANKPKGKLSCLVDFQTRVDPIYQGAAQAIREGMLGTIATGHAYYHTGRLGAQAKPDGSMQARLRNWVFDQVLSGDIIVEQNIHALDVANWFLGAHPLKAQGAGGRKGRTDVGDCWDHFVVTYWYPNDVLIDFSSNQYCVGYDDICCRLYGTNGTVDSHYGGLVNIRAKEGGYKGGQTRDIYRAGAVANIKNFADALLAGKTLDNAQESANSTLTAILGRTAAYTGQPVTWDEMLKKNQRLEAKL